MNLAPALFNRWYQTRLGLAVLETERAVVTSSISRLFDYHILQVGPSGDISLIDDSPIHHKIIFAPSWNPTTKQTEANNEALPLATDSIDVVVIHHALDFTGDSHRLLREVTRVLRPGGKMLIIGFNPLSYWGLWRIFKRRINIPWLGRFISKSRLSDWLQLLNLQIDSIDYGLHFQPIQYFRSVERAPKFEKFGQKFLNPLGGAYFILCVKQITPITPVWPRWRPLRARTTVIPLAENMRTKLH